MSYHHGNLQDALLQAALQLIAERGPSGFTLREVARLAGVSHNAPYRHFACKEDLLAAVASEGFRQLKTAMEAAMATRRTARTRLQASGEAYVAFALDHPEHFAVMFDRPPHALTSQAAQAAFDVLQQAVLEANLRGGNALQHALHAWSLVHGISKLGGAGQLPYRDRETVLGFTRSILSTALRTRRP